MTDKKITYCIEVYGKNYIQFQCKARKDFNDNLYRASKKDNSIILKNTKMDTHTGATAKNIFSEKGNAGMSCRSISSFYIVTPQ